jgi:hypothetical protein
MPEQHRNTPAQIDPWAPTTEEMELMFRALDPDASHELHGPPTREYAICIACANGYHDSPGPHADCDCPCHQPAAAQAPRKQTDLREFYTNPVAFGMKLAGVR